MSVLRAEPVPVVSRIAALDVIRGIALLGILVVNMAFFGGPLGDALNPQHMAEESPPNQVAWAIETVFFQGKFISLFSLLFGAGLALQMARADAVASGARATGIRARSTAALILRRLGILASVGLFHAGFIWYGDILFFYGVLGTLLIPARHLSARVLRVLGLALAVLSVTCVGGFGAMQTWSAAMQRNATPNAVVAAQPTTPATTEADAFLEPMERSADAAPPSESDVEPSDTRRELPFRALDLLVSSPEGPFGPEWAAMEREVYRDGPWIEVAALRVLSWAFILPVMILVYSPHIVALFLLGMAASKLGWLKREAATVQRRAALIGLSLGVSINALAAYIMWSSNFQQANPAFALAAVLLELGSYVLAIGYAGLFARLAYSGSCATLFRLLANTGRMAFTVYLAQSVLMTGLMYHWGLGMFGAFERSELLGIAVITWLALVAFANVWLAMFRIGPLEWLWRMGTYLEVPPLLRRANRPADARST
ncbi:MAG: DUF418 domain-containing protein [Phycisphaerae bacterium]|nr:DUF418 domain-containing protein [Phycisphaerae bacterium]